MLKLRKFNLHKEPDGAPEDASTFTQGVQTPHSKRSVGKKAFLSLLAICLLTVFLLGVLVVTVSATMSAIHRRQVIVADEATDMNAQQPFDCILVLGAGLRPDGSPSDMLHDRVAVGVELYHALEGVPLLMSGDHTGSYNEVAAMKALAMSLGVPEEDIFLDPKGYSTYESVLRARKIYGAKRILVVTQTYHLYRALYLSQAMDMEAFGVSADLRAYRGQTKRELRETLARFRDFFRGAQKEHLIFDEPLVPLS